MRTRGVRVKVRIKSGASRWPVGTAHILDDDDPRERQRLICQALAGRLSGSASAAMDTDPLVVRIDLDAR